MMMSLRNGLTAGCLMLLLTACASTEPVVKTETKVRTMPSEYLRDCPVPELSGERNEDLLEWALSLRVSLKSCNADKAAARKWSKAARGQ